MGDKLTEQAFWEDSYKKRKRVAYLPKPERYRTHYEFDRLFKSILRPGGSKRLLEFGVGSSIWLPYFAKEFGFEVYGIDYSKKGCEIAEQNLRSACVEGRIVNGDFFDLQDEWNGFFDVVVSFGVVEHFTDPSEVILQMSRTLKHGGMMITIVPNTEGLVFSLGGLIDRSVLKTHKVFSLSDLSDYHQKAGMKTWNTHYLGFLDLSMINFGRFSREWMRKFIGRAIIIMNMPFLYLQKITGFSVESERWCSFMIIAAVKRQVSAPLADKAN